MHQLFALRVKHFRTEQINCSVIKRKDPEPDTQIHKLMANLWLILHHDLKL